MELINRTAIRECEAGDAFAKSYATSCESLIVLADDVTSGGVAFCVVVEVNDAGIERHYVTYLVDQYFEGVFDVERGAKRSRNLVERVDLAVRFLDLIVSDVRTALSGLGHVNRAQLNRRL